MMTDDFYMIPMVGMRTRYVAPRSEEAKDVALKLFTNIPVGGWDNPATFCFPQ